MTTDSIKYESVVTTSKNLSVTQFFNQSVVFEFFGGIDPIACDLKYLYASTKQTILYSLINADKIGTEVFATDRIETMKGEQNYRFIDVIRYLSFKYGLKHEYYKNIYGEWIDMGAIRPHFCVKSSSNNIFRSLITTEVNDDILESSIYRKVGDNIVFQANLDNNWKKLCCVSDINIIPAAKYIVKDYSGNDGTVYKIKKADGTYDLEKIEPIIFENYELNRNDLVRKNAPRFTYQLADHNTNLIASGNFGNNDHHKYEDILLTFTDIDGNAYTDLDNLLVFVNGMIVDYQAGPSNNKIYINNILRYAAYQIRGIKEGYTASNYVKTRENKNGDKILDYDIPIDKIGYSYEFDIKIFKWNNVSITHFQEPLSTINLLKSEPTEPTKSVWLPVGLRFAESIDKNKTLLLCGNEIMSKDSWEVDEENSHVINLKHVSAEFDILYSEMYRKLQIYLAETVEHTLSDAPKITDYLTENLTSIEEVNEAIKLFNYAIDEYINNGGEYNYHYAKSSLQIVYNQFEPRQYAIIQFDSLDSVNYDLEIFENYDDLKFNTPMRDKFINKNWSPDDIIIINGISHRFINEYADVFIPIQYWYLRDTTGVFDDVNGYKLELVKHPMISNKYLKLNYTQLCAGPLETKKYYTYNEIKKDYQYEGEITEFDKSYVLINDTERTEGIQRDVEYYTYSSSRGYVKVPSTVTEFDESVKYYKLVFNKTYFMLK